MMQDWSDRNPSDPKAERRLRRWFVIMLVLQLLGLASMAWPLFAKPSIVPAGQRFTCTAVAVWDGDGPIWCAEGPRIRLANIAARELDGTCRPRHPCPAASGIAARDELARLLGGGRGTLRYGHVIVDPVVLACFSEGDGKGLRTAATCRLHGRDLGDQLIAAGVAHRWKLAGS